MLKIASHRMYGILLKSAFKRKKSLCVWYSIKTSILFDVCVFSILLKPAFFLMFVCLVFY